MRLRVVSCWRACDIAHEIRSKLTPKFSLAWNCDMPTLDDLQVAMGRFLTESSMVENAMLAIFAACQRERSSDDVFRDFMGETFGGMIKAFKNVCNAHPFGDTHRAILNEVYEEPDDALLPKRNFIVHGTTLGYGNDKIPWQPYRIGNADWLRQAIADD